jgi:hypothetical protein
VVASSTASATNGIEQSSTGKSLMLNSREFRHQLQMEDLVDSLHVPFYEDVQLVTLKIYRRQFVKEYHCLMEF